MTLEAFDNYKTKCEQYVKEAHDILSLDSEIEKSIRATEWTRNYIPGAGVYECSRIVRHRTNRY